MSIQAPQGILNIPNATLRVGKLAVDEVVGADTILNTVARNTILLVDDVAYHENKNWALKLPNAWAGEFECNTASAGNYSEFNFYNEGASSNAQGYNLTFNDTTVELRYDGSLLKTETLASTVTGTGVRKVRLMFERTILSVTVDGVLVFTHDDTGGPRPRVYSTTAGGFLNFFTNGGAIDNLKIVNEKWISDGTSNIAYVGGGEVAVGKALAFNRVSNVSQIKVDSNVVTEYTGPHDRPLRKYPEVALTANDNSSTSGYVASVSSKLTGTEPYHTLDGNLNSYWHSRYPYYSTSTGAYSPGTAADGQSPSGTLATNELVSGHQGEWVSIELPKKIKLEKLKVIGSTRLASGITQFPKDVVVAVSETGLTGSWSALETATLISQNVSNHSDTINITTQTSYYKYFALIVKSINSTATYSAVEIAELEFYGYEEGSGSLDTTLKSVYNVPATTGTQLEVYYDGRETSSYSGSGTSVTDISPNTNNGTLNGGVGFDSTYKAFTFNGTTTRNITTTLPSSVTGEYVHSVSLWVKADEVSRTSSGMFTFFTIGSASSANMIALGVNTGSSVDGIKYDFFDSSANVLYNPPITSNEWMHFVVTYSGGANNLPGAKRIYLNGKELSVSYGGNSVSSPLSLPTSPTLTIGGQLNSGNPPFTGSIANFRLYSKALNADQVKELYDYQKDYFLGSKSQVTLYKGHLGVGVTEPSRQLELAGDERIQEYPPGPMDGYETHIPGHGVFCAYGEVPTDSQYLAGWPWWKVFDESENTAFHGKDRNYDSTTPFAFNGQTHDVITKIVGGSVIRGEFIDLKCPYEIVVTSMKMSPREGLTSSAYLTRMPSKCIFVGSNDGTEYEILSSHSGIVYSGTAPYSANLTINATKPYKHIRLIITHLGGNGSDNGGVVNMGHLRYFGTPGPTTLDKGSLSLTRSLDVPRVSRYDVDTETPRPEKLVVDFDTTVNSSPTDISGRGNHGTFNGTNMNYSSADKAFVFNGTDDYIDIPSVSGVGTGAWVHSKSFWFKIKSNDLGVLFLLGRNGNTRQIGVQYNWPARQFQYYIYGCNSRVQVNGSDWLPDLNRWYHCVTIFKNNENVGGNVVLTGREMYIDGVKQTLVSTGTQIDLDLDSTEVRFGNQFNSIYVDYQLSNPKLYSVALEPSEVKKLYNLGRTGRSMVISDTAVGIGKVPEAQLDVRGTANFAGNVGIGRTDPGARLHVTSGTGDSITTFQVKTGGEIYMARNHTNSPYISTTMSSGYPGINFGNSTKWTIRKFNTNLDFDYEGNTKGFLLTTSSGALNFTGQHRTFIKDIPFSEASNLEGLIVSSDQNKYIKMSGGIEAGSNAITTNESLPVVSLSNVVTDKRCFGVISASEEPEQRSDAYGSFVTPFEKELGDTRVYINSVGEGAIWVTNINGSLESGDYITTSNVAGYGQKQDGAGLMNYTVAKITMDCDFNPETQPIQIIKRDETGENILDEHGQIQWEDHPTETEKAYKIRYLDADGNITDEANAVHTAAFVGCTYHCG